MAAPLTLIELQRSVNSRLRMHYAKEADQVDPDMVREFLTEAYRRIAIHARVPTAQDQQSTVAAQIAYDLPTNILGNLLMKGSVTVKTGTNSITRPDRRRWEYVRDTYGLLSNPNNANGVRDFAIDGRDRTKLLLLWPPALGFASDGLTIDYVQDPGNLSRVDDPDEATRSASVTNNNAVVNFSSAITGLFEAGDYFGVKASDLAIPTVFIEILTIDDADTITLVSNFTGTTDTTAPYTVSQVPELEKQMPGMATFIPADYAVYRILQIEEPEGRKFEIALGQWTQGLQEIKKIARTDPGWEPSRDFSLKRFPALRRKGRGRHRHAFRTR